MPEAGMPPRAGANPPPLELCDSLPPRESALDIPIRPSPPPSPSIPNGPISKPVRGGDASQGRMCCLLPRPSRGWRRGGSPGDVDRGQESSLGSSEDTAVAVPVGLINTCCRGFGPPLPEESRLFPAAARSSKRVIRPARHGCCPLPTPLPCSEAQGHRCSGDRTAYRSSALLRMSWHTVRGLSSSSIQLTLLSSSPG